MTSYASSELDVTLEVDGTRFRVAHFGCIYELNQIPRARCMLEIGRDALTGQTPSRVHTQLNKLTKMLPCQVFFQGYGEYSPGLAWPDQETVIFRGYIMGTGFEKAGGQVKYVVDIVHWLYDLDCTSTISKYSHVTNNTAYTFQAIVNRAITTGVDVGEVAAPAGGDAYGAFMLFQSDIADVINPDALDEDFWGRVLKPILVRLAEEAHVEFETDVSDCLGPLEGKNDRALAALARMEGVTGEFGHDTDLEHSCYTPKLSLVAPRERDDIPTEVAYAISDAIGYELIQSLAGQSAWGKLIQYASQYFFSVVPQAERALVIPMACGLRETYCKSITANDYDFIQLPALITRPLRAIGVLGSVSEGTNIFAAASTIMGLGGCYAPDDATLKDGMIRLVSPPAWLSSVASSAVSADKTSGIGEEKPVSTATTPPEEPAEDSRGHVDGTELEEVFLNTKDMFDRYAHAFYMVDTLRGREGMLSGKLRFDIAPGSTVRVEVDGEQHIGREDDLAGAYIGAVISVSIDINAETGRAGTGFTLRHVRTEVENSSDLTSVDHHPLYTTIFTGAPLIPDLAFPEEGSDCCFGD